VVVSQQGDLLVQPSHFELSMAAKTGAPRPLHLVITL
jgi:hypothetical protein